MLPPLTACVHSNRRGSFVPTNRMNNSASKRTRCRGELWTLHLLKPASPSLAKPMVYTGYTGTITCCFSTGLSPTLLFSASGTLWSGTAVAPLGVPARCLCEQAYNRDPIRSVQSVTQQPTTHTATPPHRTAVCVRSCCADCGSFRLMSSCALSTPANDLGRTLHARNVPFGTATVCCQALGGNSHKKI